MYMYITLEGTNGWSMYIIYQTLSLSEQERLACGTKLWRIDLTDYAIHEYVYLHVVTYRSDVSQREPMEVFGVFVCSGVELVVGGDLLPLWRGHHQTSIQHGQLRKLTLRVWVKDSY